MINSQPTEPLLLTITQATAYACMSRSGVYRELAAGRLKARKDGSRTLVTVDSLKAYVAALPEAKFGPGS